MATIFLKFQDLLGGLISRRRTFPYDAVAQSETEELMMSDMEATPDTPPKMAEDIPYPTKQIICLLILAFAEPITYAQKAPYIPQLIEDLGIIGDDKRKVGYYSGFIDTVYYCVEGIFILQWSRISDRIGRRPVLLVGVIGLSFSSVCFGYSKTFLGVLISNSLAGVLNSNWAVTRSAMADILDSPRFTSTIVWQPAVWSAGTLIGSLLGGSLSHPAEKYPNVFSGNEIWKEYPFLLPCGLSATICAIIFILGFFLLKETLPKKQQRRALSASDDRGEFELLHEGSDPLASNVLTANEPVSPSHPSLRALLTRPMVIILVNYGIFVFHDISIGSIIPLFLAAPIEAGGLAFSSDQIGLCLAVISIYNMTFQVFAFAKVETRWGSEKLARWAMLAMVAIYLVFPIHGWMAKTGNLGFITWLLLLFQLMLVPFGLVGVTCFAILLTAATPSSSYGTANGLMQSSAAAVRIVAPVTVASLFALSLEKNLAGGNLMYYFGAAAAFLGYAIAGRLASENTL
ncbi:hypothetical protein M422DRAFT_232613 [Sphaerobolus stellatus SS14]|uniref:Major facilitator superfamily (MFS) profile domain-containing protein n=1 Tax=Sphaerobolus stellatus (strain SS14) TaxID=990650 RepID=A0A0C9V3Q8_SPHS4|nr:hypothetical protein M422DRAFT_232613 [Sphaerobolus stellatus SS14]